MQWQLVEVFPQLGKNLIGFKLKHNKVPENIPRHWTGEQGLDLLSKGLVNF